MDLSLRVGRAFSPEKTESGPSLKLPVIVGKQPAVMQIEQTCLDPPVLNVWSTQSVRKDVLKSVAEWVVLSELNLVPFYSISEKHKKLGPIISRLYGLKHLRPATIFEMAVIAVTEQQISLAAAYRIRHRLVERFGRKIESFWLFPTPAVLSDAPLQELTSCGLSLRKAGYIKDLSMAVSDGRLDLESTKRMDDDNVRNFIEGQRGFGRWSANYILIRGLGRPDAVPSDDLGIRTILGYYLGDGSRMSPAQVEESLEQFRPYRGLAMFYFLADWRLSKAR